MNIDKCYLHHWHMASDNIFDKFYLIPIYDLSQIQPFLWFLFSGVVLSLG